MMGVIVDHGAVTNVQNTRGRNNSERGHITGYDWLERVQDGILNIRINSKERRVNECVLCSTFIDATCGGTQTVIHHRWLIDIHYMNRDVCIALLTKDIRNKNNKGIHTHLLIINALLKRDQSSIIANRKGAERSIRHQLKAERRRKDARNVQWWKKNSAHSTVFQYGVRDIINHQRRLVRIKGYHYDNTRVET